MYYETAIRNTVIFAIGIIETIVPSSTDKLEAMQDGINETILNGRLVKTDQDEIGRLDTLQNRLDKLAEYIAEQVKPEAQTLVEHGIIAKVVDEVFMWSLATAESIKIIQDELAGIGWTGNK